MPIDDTGWKSPIVTAQDGLPTGTIQTASGLERQPCFLCRSFEKDNRKLIQHFQAHGLTADENGCYETPIAKEVRGRRSLKIDPRDYGFCRRHGYVTGMNATCPDFKLTESRSELQAKIGDRK
jgi:hypothetical protein